MDDVIVLKIAILGECGVGKTSLLHTFVEGSFKDKSETTIGMDYKAKVMMIDGKHVKLTIWDTAGMERFQSPISSICRNLHGAILVYDIGRRETLMKVKSWLDEVDTFSENAVKMIVGNKTELESREVTSEEGRRLARAEGTLFMEASAKTGSGVESLFQELVQKILEKPEVSRAYSHGTIHLEESSSQDNRSFCARCFSSNR